jgi:hypothetical protein
LDGIVRDWLFYASSIDWVDRVFGVLSVQSRLLLLDGMSAELGVDGWPR